MNNLGWGPVVKENCIIMRTEAVTGFAGRHAACTQLPGRVRFATSPESARRRIIFCVKSAVGTDIDRPDGSNRIHESPRGPTGKVAVSCKSWRGTAKSAETCEK